MKKPIITRCVFRLLLMLMSGPVFLNAQKLVDFNGYKYREYPHYIETNHYFYEDRNAPIRLNASDFQFTGAMLPPCIGDLPDGEYVFYSTNFYNRKIKESTGKKVWIKINYVYATCKIVNGKKNGFAKLYSEYNQMFPYDSIPYKDDLIEGSFNFRTINRNSEEIGYYGHADYSCHLNYKSGLPDGIQNLSVTVGKKHLDTALVIDVAMRMGLFEGPYFKKYRNEDSNVKNFGVSSGIYKKGIKEGQWLNINPSNEKTIYNYLHDRITEESQFKNGRIYRRYVYGRDSVEKILLNEREELIPHVHYNWLNIYIDRDYICYQYDAKGDMTYTFAYGNMARSNFYLFFGYKSMYKLNDLIVLKDSMSVRPSRWNQYTKYVIHHQYIKRYDIKFVGDTFNYMREEEGYYYGLGFLKQVRYNKKGKVIDTTYAYNYKELVYGSKQEDEKNIDPPGVIILPRKNYYIKMIPNDFYGPLYEFEYTKGDFKGLALRYDVFKVDSNEYLTRSICIPYDNGKLVLIDTFYKNEKKFNSINEGFFEHNVINRLMLSESGKLVTSNDMLTFLYDFFIPLPVVHRTVLLNEQPYTGQVYLKVRGWRKESKFDVDYKFDSVYRCYRGLEEEDWGCRWRKFKKVTINLSYKTYGERYRWNWKWGVMPANWRLEVDSGLFDGNLLISEHSKWSEPIKYKSGFVKNKVDGEIEKGSTYYQYKDYMRFDTGKLNGQVIQYGGRGISNVLRYKQGRMTGDQLHFNEIENKYLDKSLSVVNDTLDGTTWSYSIKGYPTAKGNFKKGLPHGYFYTYYSDTSNGKFASRIQFDQGALVGEMLYYNNKKILVEKVEIPGRDSIEYHSLHDFMDYPYYHESNVYNELINVGYTFIDSIEKIIPARAYYTLYYPDGAKFSEGWKVHGEAEGEWKFYRQDGQSIYKIIYFENKWMTLNDSVSFYTYGKVTAYYENGAKMFEGLATDSRSRYSCDSHSDMPIEDDLYTVFYDTSGNNLMQNDSAYIVEYQINGYKFKEGVIVNGLKEGLWLYYDQNGNLEMFGFYKNGKKSGRWVTGDLSGVHVDPYLCFLSTEEFMAWMMKYGSNLLFTEDFYNNGELIRSSNVRTKKK